MKEEQPVARKTIIILLIIIALSGGAWFYFSQTRNTGIEKLLNNPTEYTGKVVTIEGEVTDRSGFFNNIKFYKIKDKSGEIIVTTKSRNLPGIKSSAIVKGRIDDAFPLGDQKLTVLVEESVEEKP
jgi:hypothetical protein